MKDGKMEEGEGKVRWNISVRIDSRARYSDKSETEGYDLKIEIIPINVVIIERGRR
jgi:hypothetical protein